MDQKDQALQCPTPTPDTCSLASQNKTLEHYLCLLIIIVCVWLVSKHSVRVRWAALMYSTAIYIDYAIFLPNYDCGSGGRG